MLVHRRGLEKAFLPPTVLRYRGDGQMDIERWPAGALGRSRAVAFGSLLWVVANATNANADFQAQVAETLARLDASLQEAGSNRSSLLSVQVLLNDIGLRSVFDEMWLTWIGPDPDSWPQRACFQVGLSTGLLVELIVVAARN
jgi:enamine deaminase RidA (YjgF/YER057c/UK114 family)